MTKFIKVARVAAGVLVSASVVAALAGCASSAEHEDLAIRAFQADAAHDSDGWKTLFCDGAQNNFLSTTAVEVPRESITVVGSEDVAWSSPSGDRKADAYDVTLQFKFDGKAYESHVFVSKADDCALDAPTSTVL
ncbi:hypothetical protein [Microbacterium gorillae]|uniref:hypothetical protein n=1 Tax=Microbacterium gorillae TaxID=1231063 RepID=UPI003D96F1F7